MTLEEMSVLLKENKTNTINRIAEEIRQGKFKRHFVLDVIGLMFAEKVREVQLELSHWSMYEEAKSFILSAYPESRLQHFVEMSEAIQNAEELLTKKKKEQENAYSV